jgi:hypothetical protein
MPSKLEYIQQGLETFVKKLEANGNRFAKHENMEQTLSTLEQHLLLAVLG